MTVRIKTEWPEQPSPATATVPSFAALRPRGSNRALSFFSSLGLHLATIWLTLSTYRAVQARRALIREDYPTRSLQMAAYVVWPARLTDPATSTVRTQAAGQVPGKPVSPPPPQATPPANSGSSEEQAQPIEHQGKRFMFPVVNVPKTDRQILVQMNVPPDLKLKPNTVVPDVLLWQLPAPVKPKEELVAAAHKEEQPVHEREAPSVTPQLTARNRERELAELRHAAEPPVPVPAIPLPVANTTPIRLLDGVPGPKLPNSTGPVVQAPEEVHVISVPELPVPQPRVIVLPQGNQGTPPPSPVGVSTSLDGKQAGAGGDGASKSGQASNQPGGAGSAGSSGGTGKSSSLNARVGDGGADSDRGTTGRGAESAAGAGGEIGPPPPGAMRIVRPKDGKFTVVVLGSANLQAYPEAAGILSGKLVYTVYVRTGGRKEWILEFCLPRGAEQGVKTRGSAVPIEAPYPFVIYRPHLTPLNDPDYLIVHGYITAAGRFDHLSALGDIDSASKELLIGALEHWEFRPASRDGEPSAVEIALIIPRERI